MLIDLCNFPKRLREIDVATAGMPKFRLAEYKSPKNNEPLQSPAAPLKIVLGETLRNRRLSASTLAESHPNCFATSLNPDMLGDIAHYNQFSGV